MCSDPLEAHEKTTSPQGPGISPKDFLQLRNAGLVIAVASVAAANPIEYHLDCFFAAMTISFKVNDILYHQKNKSQWETSGWRGFDVHV